MLKRGVFVLLVLIQEAASADPDYLPKIPKHSEDEVQNENELKSDKTFKNQYKREIALYEDNTDYNYFPRCGNLEMRFSRRCYCGNDTLVNIQLSEVMCCVPPHTSCIYTNPLDKKQSDIICKEGVTQLKLKSCNGECFNDYEKSSKLHIKSHFYCPDTDYCIPIQDMCSGLCPREQDTCDDSLRCYQNGYEDEDTWNTKTTLISDYVKGHKYCSKSKGENNGAYNQVTRLDEERLSPLGEAALNLSLLLKPCKTVKWRDGYKCDNAVDANGCIGISLWCAGTGGICQVGDISISRDNTQLCANETFLQDQSCDVLDKVIDKDLVAYGLRCSGKSKGCYYPFYNFADGEPLGSMGIPVI